MKRFPISQLLLTFTVLLFSINSLSALTPKELSTQYDSTYGFVRYDSNSVLGKSRMFSDNNVHKLLNQELFIRQIFREKPKIDLRLRHDSISKMDPRFVYKCCDTSNNGSYSSIYSSYDKIKDIKFKIVEIRPSDKFAPWLSNKIDLQNHYQQETYILSLKPNNSDPIVYYWFHPYSAYVYDFELFGFYDKLKKQLLNRKFVVSNIPYPLSDSALDLTEKWTLTEIRMVGGEGNYAILEDRFGHKIDFIISKYLYPVLSESIYTEERAEYFLKKYKKKLWEATLKRELTLGMPSELILEIWRSPDNVSKRVTKAKTTEKWDYSDGSYLVLENGKLTEIYYSKD